MDPITEPLPLPDGYGEATRILPWVQVRGGLSGLRPRVALAWTRYPEDATRFRFE